MIMRRLESGQTRNQLEVTEPGEFGAAFPRMSRGVDSVNSEYSQLAIKRVALDNSELQ